LDFYIARDIRTYLKSKVLRNHNRNCKDNNEIFHQFQGKMMRLLLKFFIYLLIFTSLPVSALEEEQPLLLTFFDLDASTYQQNTKTGQLIEIRGFLYEANDSTLILAAEPNLKSCCVGSTSKRNRQLLVKSDSLETSQTNAITLKGHLIIDPNDTFPFKLENAEIVAIKNQNKTLLLFLSVIAVLSVGTYLWYKRRKS
jgi:hypothetical protein